MYSSPIYRRPYLPAHCMSLEPELLDQSIVAAPLSVAAGAVAVVAKSLVVLPVAVAVAIMEVALPIAVAMAVMGRAMAARAVVARAATVTSIEWW